MKKATENITGRPNPNSDKFHESKRSTMIWKFLKKSGNLMV
jgi:hypothetical protein